MVYVAADGTVHQYRPWGIGRIVDYFWGAVGFVVYFFRTLVPGGGPTSSTGGGRGRGSGSGPGGPGGPGGPRRRMGGITTIQDCSMPGGG